MPLLCRFCDAPASAYVALPGYCFKCYDERSKIMAKLLSVRYAELRYKAEVEEIKLPKK